MSGDFRGVLTTLNHALPAGLDGTRLAQWRMRDGVSYAEVRSQIASALDDFNAELLATYGDLVTVGDYDAFEYANGGAVLPLTQGSSGSRGESFVAPVVGHSLDLQYYEESLVGDPRFFRDARKSVIVAQLKYITQKFRDIWETKVFGRFFTSAERLLGANGWDVPFANANPNANTAGGITYIPMKWGGKTFTSSHNHYIGYDSGNSKTFADVFAGLASTINEHGWNGPYTAYVSEADVVTIQALPFYIKPVNNIAVIDRGGLTSGNTFFMDGMILGVPALGGRFIGAYDTGYGVCGLYATNRLTTGYVGMYKSFGALDARNPLAIRIHPDFGFGAKVMEIPDITSSFPVSEINMQIEFSAGMGMNRTIGAAGLLVSGGTWVDATIS